MFNLKFIKLILIKISLLHKLSNCNVLSLFFTYNTDFSEINKTRWSIARIGNKWNHFIGNKWNHFLEIIQQFIPSNVSIPFTQMCTRECLGVILCLKRASIILLDWIIQHRVCYSLQRLSWSEYFQAYKLHNSLGLILHQPFPRVGQEDELRMPRKCITPLELSQKESGSSYSQFNSFIITLTNPSHDHMFVLFSFFFFLISLRKDWVAFKIAYVSI